MVDRPAASAAVASRDPQTRPRLGERFAEDTRRLLRDRNGVGMIAAAFVFPSFVFEDMRLAADRWQHMALLRIVCALFCILCFGINKTRIGERHPFALTLLGLGIVSVTKTFLSAHDAGGLAALYFGGHALLIVGALALLPLSLGQAVVAAATVQLSYVIPMVMLFDDLHSVGFLVQNALMGTMAILLCIGCHMDHQLRLRAFRLLHRLYDARRRAEDYG